MLLHPGSVFGVLIVGVLLCGVSVRAIADQLHVTARIPAPPLTEAATITTPIDGQTFTASPITVTGTCPDNSYVNLYRNGMFSGVSLCVGQNYSIDTDLFVGRNTLLVQAYNSTDDAGPSTPSIDVTYAPPATGGSPDQQYVPAAPGTTGNDGTPSEQAGPLLLWSDYRFSVFTAKSSFTWKMSFQSGKPPFSVKVNWGDGSDSGFSIANHDEFEINHTYDRPGYYTVFITGKDALGKETHLQLLALIKLPGALGTIGSIISGKGDSQAPPLNFRWLLVAWPAYLVIALMVLSFWLGERREYLQLIGRPQRRRHA
jgi:hypothetical protein